MDGNASPNDMCIFIYKENICDVQETAQIECYVQKAVFFALAEWLAWMKRDGNSIECEMKNSKGKNHEVHRIHLHFTQYVFLGRKKSDEMKE